MIEPINLDGLNKTNELKFECLDCGKKDTMFMYTEDGKRRNLDLDSQSDLDFIKSIECPFCGKKLSEK